MIRQKKQKKEVVFGIGRVNIKTTFNNTIISIADSSGNVLCWASSGTSGFKGTRKSTSYAAQTVCQDVILKALDFGIKKIEIILTGRGSGREACLRALGLPENKFEILSIKDKTTFPSNGCRPPKKRRL